MDVHIIGRVRQLLEGVDATSVSNDEQITLTPQLEQLIAAGAAPYREIVRMGRAFQVMNTTAVAAVVAVPTTAIHLALYNNAPDGGRSLVIDSVGALNVVSTAVAASAVVLGNIGQVRETAPTDAALAIKKLNGYAQGQVDTVARTTVGGTALPGTTGLVANWFPVTAAFAKAGAVATPGYGVWQQCDGRYIIPPGRYFALTVMANVVGETFITHVAWHEVQLNLG